MCVMIVAAFVLNRSVIVIHLRYLFKLIFVSGDLFICLCCEQVLSCFYLIR
jgi:hypothetical protein